MKMKKTLALFLALLMLLSLCACGASAKGGDSAAPQGAAMDMAAEAPAAAPEPVPVEDSVALSGAGLAGETAPAEPSAGDAGEIDPDKIIYSADVTVETTAFDEAVAGVSALIEDYGGWIESSSVNDANYYSRARGYASSRSASYTLRVPSERFNQLMSSLSELGNVPYTHTYTENVTAQYYDVQARLTAYQAQETRLLEMMEKAQTVEDVISIEEKLTELRYQIESLQSTLTNYDRQVNYSTVYLSLEEVQEYTPQTEQQLSYGRQLVLALQRGLRSFRDGLGDLILALAAALPTLIVLAVIVVLVVLGLKKRRARRKAKKAAQVPPEEKKEP